MNISPAPSEEEAVAIVAAYEALWPRMVVVEPQAERNDRDTSWRFSGRWWAKPVPTRRARP
jgi:hypothetical protein